MATEDIPCQHDLTPPCTESSYSKCPHCSFDLCLEHIVEHQNHVRVQYNEVTDQINQQKSTLNNHSTIDEMRETALAKLENWKATKLEIVMSVYNAERIRVESTCYQCIDATSEVRNRIFEELNKASCVVEKKKNIHPSNIAQMKKKLNELNTAIQQIVENVNANLTTIVAEIKLPETIVLKQQLESPTNVVALVQRYKNQIEEKDRTIRTQYDEIQSLQQIIDKKNPSAGVNRKVTGIMRHQYQ